jgi:glycosyltransferase involved in cell wall biosynthesis/ubiquinone/menaquinone biosynthesis C-methylase UbiE
MRSITPNNLIANKYIKNNFKDFTYAKKAHFELFKEYSDELYKQPVDPASCALKRYQDPLVFSFIKHEILKGSRILEIGGGKSRLSTVLKNDYEYWNLDRLSGEANFDYTSKGLGKGPLTIDSSGCRLVKDYIGYFNKNLPDNYFDFVFSISVLEHVPDDNPVYLMDVKNDINRVLKPGGLSLHCFDIIIKNGSVWTNKLLPFLFNNVKTINPFVPLESLQDDPELFVLSKKAYEKHWEKVTKRNYEDFGKPSSYNILWQKSAQAINKAQDQPPVLIYQMGKVGSSTILNSLKQCGFKNHIYHIHFLSEINIKRTEKAIRKSLSPKTPQHLKESVSVRQQIDNKSRRIKWKIITLVRDPIAQRISSIFENSNLLKGFNPSDKNTALEILENRILYHFNAFDEHTDIAASWFDNELKTVFDFDVYNVNFDKSRGYQIYHTENADILLLRLEDLNRCYKKAFKLFLGIDDLTLIKSNIGAEKKHHDLYERVKKDIVIPANDLKKVYQTKYSKHFYTTAEINNFTNKWSRGKSNNPNGIKAATKFPKISIVTPSFNQAEYLEECIDSILSQGYPNLEYIIMDGGSTDGSVEIIKKYEKHLTYWQSQPDGGQYNAVNEGFKRTTGDIMTWLNSDDYFQKDALKVAAAIFNSRQDISWIMCRPNGINSEGIPWVLTDLPLWHRQKYLQKEYRKPFIQQEGTFWKRSLWDRAGMTLQTDLQMAGDLELWARFFRHAQLHSVDVLLASYRSHPGQKAQTHMDIYISEADSILDREINHFENSSTRELMPAPNPVNFETVNNLTHEMFNIRINSNACLINAHGEKHLANGNTAAAIKSFFKACSLDPKNATTYSNLGLAYSATGNHKQSLQSFEKSIQLDPNNKTALLNISKVATTQNTEDQSISVHKTYNERNSAGIASQAAQFRTNSSLELQHDEHTLHAQTSDVYRVSAIISTYNSEEFITECLKDLVNQTLYKQGKLEIIVINSGSEQNEEIIVKDFQNKHINITYLQTERETLYAAWNRGIKIAKGTYITNANTDDRHHPEALEIMAKELDNDQSIDLVYSNCKETSVAHQLFAEAPANTIYDYPPFFAPRSLLHYQFGPQPMWRKTIHAKIGYFDDSYFAVGDYEFNIRLALQCRAKLIPKVLGLFYKHDDSITSSYRHQHKEKQNLFTAFRNESTILQLYKKEGFKIKTSQEKATALNKMGFLALNYKKPWEETFTSDLEFSLYCFKHALPYDSSNQTIQYHINELMKVINKTDTLNLSKFTEDLSPNIQESQQSNDLSTSSKSHFLKKRLTVIAHRNNITFMDNIIPWFKENFDLHIANVDNQEEIRMVLAESDIVWVEWATKIAVQVSMMPRKGKLIVRLHSFEAFDNFPQKIAWENIDDVIFVANHIKDIAVSRVPSLHKKTRLHIIENSVDLDNFQFNNHSRGSKLAFVGAIRHAKNLPFLLQCFKAAYDMDSSLSLHIAGDYMDTSSALEVNELNVYIKHIINKLNLLNSVIFYGQVKDISGWLKDKDYIISTSIRESTAVNLLEAMAMGLKPVIHNFPAAEELYPKKYIFSDIEEFKQIIFSDDYSSEEYRSFVETHFSKNIQINKIRSLIHQYEEVAGTRHVCKNIHLQNINLPYSLENKFELINYANKQFEEAHQIKNRGHQLGMIEEAIKLLEKAHQIDPSDSSIARNIAMVYKKTGDLEKASLWQKKDLVANEL